MVHGQIFVVSAPSGAGKTSLVSALLEADDNLMLSVSHTTRTARQNEKDGQNYFFVSQQEFEELVEQNKMLEHASVYGKYYGTCADNIDTALGEGRDVILEIDWQGAQQVREIMPEALSIFIMPPSPEVLKQRLNDRNSEDEASMAKRMADVSAEIAQAQLFDYIILNDDFAEALASLQAIVLAARHESSMQISNLSEILEKFSKKS